MILAEKIMSLRKQNGWSQEELAEQLNVSRQSVSKWESTASIPDIEKIVRMSELFGVSTDYLLKEDEDTVCMQETKPTAIDDSVKEGKVISMEFATEYMDHIQSVAKRIAFAVALCIMSPVALIFLAGMSEAHIGGITEGVASGIGLCVLFVFVACAVAIFILDGMKLSKYEFLEKEKLTLKYGVEAAVMRRKEVYAPVFRMTITIAVLLCIISAVPVILAGCLEASDFICIICVCVLLFIVSVACFMFVSSGMIYSSYQKLMQEDEFTPENKENMKKTSVFSSAYWCLATAVYLIWSFITNDWEITWIVWAVAGVLYPPFHAIAARNK
ncbi:MAG: helix-turn-helix transcriptional regulator [Eubacteriales bacterium]|nr:helix-turn-helix transcriptional regulator [Eubacteriales bacterium]